MFYGDEKTFKQRRGADLLQTEEEIEDNDYELNDRVTSPQFHNPHQSGISNIFYATSNIKNNSNLREENFQNKGMLNLD